MTIVSNTDMHPAEAYEPPETGGDHFRSSAVFLTQSHPKQTQSSDVRAGTSFDQLYAQKFGQETPMPSLQLAIESAEGSGGCDYNYSCVYVDCDQLGNTNQTTHDDSRSANGFRSILRCRNFG